MYKNALVIGAELLTRIVDWKDRATCVLFGDAAGSMVMGPETRPDRGVLSTHLHTDGTQADFLNIPGGGSKKPLSQEVLDNREMFVKMQGREVFKTAVRSLEAVSREALEKNGLRTTDVQHVIAHQANLRILEAVMKRLEIPVEKCHLNIEQVGNTSSASVPLTLDQANRQGALKDGDVILMMAIGGGMSWGSASCAGEEEMKIAFVFPGQGSQYVGMGQALAQAFPAARAALDEADAALGGGLSRLMSDGPEDELRKTANTQPAILAVSTAAHRVLMKEAGGKFQFPAFYAGHSLGEYSALVCAGAMSLTDAIKAVRARGQFMQEAVPAGEGAMAAILGLEAMRSEEGLRRSARAGEGQGRRARQLQLAGADGHRGPRLGGGQGDCRLQGEGREARAAAARLGSLSLLAHVAGAAQARGGAGRGSTEAAERAGDRERHGRTQYGSGAHHRVASHAGHGGGALGGDGAKNGLERRGHGGGDRPRQGARRARPPHRQELEGLLRRGSGGLAGAARRGLPMKRTLLLCLLALAACVDRNNKKLRDDVCKKNIDCAFGLECLEGGTQADGGLTTGKTCQFHSFGDCEGDGTQPGLDGQPQCLRSYKCRDSHCTVQCAGHKDCKENEVCRVGQCQKGGNSKSTCYETRDCAYPQVCQYGQCVLNVASRCTTDLDCPSGSRCVNAVCQ